MKNIAAALIFFTRLPFYKLKLFNVPAEHFKQAINYWPVIGWLTGGITALMLWVCSFIFPPSIAVLLAITTRLLLTGALHEDGLSDFFDGLGGGTTKTRVLEIMKDSRIGVYGVISLILYFLLLHQCLTSLGPQIAVIAILSADPLAKLIASNINKVLPYARTEETSKAKVVYGKMSIATFIFAYVLGLTPFIFLIPYEIWWIIIFPILTFVLIYGILKKRIQGYTGDCCGALFLLCELSIYLGILLTLNI